MNDSVTSWSIGHLRKEERETYTRDSGREREGQWEREGGTVGERGRDSGREREGQWEREGETVGERGRDSRRERERQWEREGGTVGERGRDSGREREGQWEREGGLGEGGENKVSRTWGMGREGEGGQMWKEQIERKLEGNIYMQSILCTNLNLKTRR